MKIAKALKKKNKIVRELGKLLTKVQQNNSLLEGKTRSYDPEEMLNESHKKLNELVELKTKISKANEPVQDKIYRLSELKSFIENIKNISTIEGPSESTSWGRDENKVVNYTVKITTVKKDELVQNLEDEIEKIQEELDIHNYTTEI